MAEFNFTTVGVDTLNTFIGGGPVARFSHGQVFHVGPNFAASKLQQLIDATTVEEQYQIIESEARWGYDLVNLPIIISEAVAGIPPTNPPAITSVQARKGLNLNSVGNDYTQAINLNATGIKQGIHNVKYNMQIPAQQGEYMFNLVVLHNTIGVVSPDNEEQMPIAAVYLFDSAVKKLAGQGTISIDVVLRYMNGVSIDAIEWVTPVAEYANLIHMDSVNSLPPVSSFVGSKNNHVYIVNGLDGLDPSDPTVFYGRDLNDRSFLAKSEGESLYSFSSHCRDVAEGVLVVSVNGPDANGNYYITYDDSGLVSPLGVNYDTLVQGRYILQFTDGASKGLCRSVTRVDTAAKRIYFNDSVVGGSFGAGTFQLLVDNTDETIDALAIDVNPTANTIPQRDVDGKLKAQDPVDNFDVVNKQYYEGNFSTLLDTLFKRVNYQLPIADLEASFDTDPGAGSGTLGSDFYAGFYQAGSTGYSLSFNNTGSKLFFGTGSTIYEYSLSENYRVDTATYTGNSVAVTASHYDMIWNPDGTKFYIVGGTSGSAYIHQYSTLSPFSLSGAFNSYSRGTLGPSTFETVKSLLFNSDGTRLYEAQGVNVYYGTLALPYDLSSLSYVGSLTLPYAGKLRWNATGTVVFGGESAIASFPVPTPYDLTSVVATLPTVITPLPMTSDSNNGPNNYCWVNSGNTLMVRTAKGNVIEVTASIPYDITTLYSHTGILRKLMIGRATEDIKWKHDGSSIFLSINFLDSAAPTFGYANGNYIIELKLHIPYDIRSAYFDGNISPALVDDDPFAFNNDGTKVFIAIAGNIEQFTLSPAYDLSSLTTTGVTFATPSSFERMTIVDSGNKILGSSAADNIYLVNLAVAYDLSTASYSGNTFAEPVITNVGGVHMNAAGTKLIVSSFLHREYDISPAWDLTSASFLRSGGHSIASSASTTLISDDGTKVVFFTPGSNEEIEQGFMTTGFDVSTAKTASVSLSANRIVPAGNSYPLWVDSGNKLICSNSNTIFSFPTTTPYSIVGLSDFTQSLDTTGVIASFALKNAMFNTSGNRLYAIGSTDTGGGTLKIAVVQYNLGTPFDLTTAVFSTSKVFDDRSETGFSSRGVFWDNIGSNIYLCVDTAVYQYTLGVPYDISTIPATVTKTFTPTLTNYTSYFYINPTGTKLFSVSAGGSGGAGDFVFEYEFSTPFDVDTLPALPSNSKGIFHDPNGAATISTDGSKLLTFDSSIPLELDFQTNFDVTTLRYPEAFIDFTPAGGILFSEPNPQDVIFGLGGTKMYVVGLDSDAIIGFNLSTAYDLDTAVFAGELDLSGQELQPRGACLSPDGTILFVVGTANDTVYSYTLGTAFDITTAVYSTNSFSVAAQSTSPSAIIFNNDGTKFFVADSASNIIYQYTLGAAYDITTAAYATLSLDVTTNAPAPTGIAWNADGTGLIVSSTTNANIVEYGFTTAYTINTGVFLDKTFKLTKQQTAPLGVAWSNSGHRMFAVGNVGSFIHAYATQYVRYKV